MRNFPKKCYHFASTLAIDKPNISDTTKTTLKETEIDSGKVPEWLPLKNNDHHRIQLVLHLQESKKQFSQSYNIMKQEKENSFWKDMMNPCLLLPWEKGIFISGAVQLIINFTTVSLKQSKKIEGFLPLTFSSVNALNDAWTKLWR